MRPLVAPGWPADWGRFYSGEQPIPTTYITKAVHAMRPLKPFEIFVQGVRPLTLPQHTVTSYTLLSRRSQVQDDLLRRTISTMSAEFGGDPLVALRERRYMLTTTGWKVFKLGSELISIGRGEGDQQLTEVVTVEVAPAIDFRFMAGPLRSFHEAYGNLVTVKLVPFDADGIRSNLASTLTSFGMAFVDPDGSSGASLLERPVAWSAVVPAKHSLADSPTPIPVDGLASSARVFVAAEFAEALAPHVGAGPNVVVLPTPEAVRVAVSAELGVGLDLDFGGYDEPESYLRVPVSGLKPLRIGLYLPRKPECLSEAARFLLDLLKSPGRATESRPPAGSEPAAEPQSEPLSV